MVVGLSLVRFVSGIVVLIEYSSDTIVTFDVESISFVSLTVESIAVVVLDDVSNSTMAGDESVWQLYKPDVKSKTRKKNG